MFHGNKREDCVIVHTADGTPLFAQLLFVFKCFVADKEYKLALIHKFDQTIPSRERPHKDADLGLLRVHASPRKCADFIFVDSIIRGALLAEDYASTQHPDRLVIDTIDTDMFIRLRGMHRL